MSGQFKGTINIDIRDSIPDWEPFGAPRAPEGAPNVVYIVLDDVGFSDLPIGENLILSAAFDKDGEDPRVATGILSLYHGETKVGEGRIKTPPGYFSLAGEGLAVGRDSGEPVTDDDPGVAPNRFTGGTIHRVAVDVSVDPFVDLEREAAAMLARE